MPVFLKSGWLARYLLAFLLAVSLSTLVAANDSGGGGGAAPMVFTVNLGAANYLQVGLILEPAKPEAAHLLSAYKPRIQHEIIMLLAGRDEGKLRSLEGKRQLLEDILEAVNRVIDEDEKTGVKDVLLSNFIIQ